MVKELLQVTLHSLTITGFVFVMMLAIEYINVQTKGLWQENLSKSKWKIYLLAAFLGAIPGCLGAFTAVVLFSHKLISFGAIVTTMIATSGDEAFVMFAMFPEKAALLTIIIFLIGILAGVLVDKFSFAVKFSNWLPENSLPLHQQESCKCFQKDKILNSLLKPTIYRLSLVLIISTILIAVSLGLLAGKAEPWMRFTIIIAVLFSLFVVTTVPNHFLKEHLWDHIVKSHILNILLWTFFTLLILHFLNKYVDINSLLADNMLWVLVVAVLVGIIPESGPHLIFVTLFASGSIPFSILLASSISQDGHGMLPLLAESKKGFLAVKLVNVFFALLTGFIGYLMNF